MTYEASAIQRLRVALETGRANYAVDQTASPANFLDVQFTEGSVNATRGLDHLDPQSTQQYLDQYDKKVLGKTSASLSFTSNLSGTGTALTGNVAPESTTTWWTARLLETMMGGFNVATVAGASTLVVAAGSTVTTINITAGHGAKFDKGGAVGFVVNGRYELREILSAAVNSVTLKVALSAIPADGSQVLHAYTFYMTEQPLNALQFIHEGRETSNRFAYFGMQGSFSLDVTTAALARMTLNLSGANWSQLTPASLSGGTVAMYNPVAVIDSEFIVQAVGTSTLNKVDCQNQTWTPGINYSPITTPDGVGNSTLLGWVRNRGRAISGSFQPYFNQSALPDWYTSDSSRTNLAMFQQIGGSLTSGGLILLSAPTVQIMTPQAADNGGISGLTVQWEGRQDAAVSSPTTDLHRSAFRIHMFR